MQCTNKLLFSNKSADLYMLKIVRKKIISTPVLLLSIVSLFTDMASEMLYPIMPIFLQSIGYSVLLIGIIEGVAEAVAGFSKGYFGTLSDGTGKRLPFVKIGYALSAFSKPLMALFLNPAWVLTTRIIDRIGKGVRTGARDALLSDEATPQTKATVFGFHRSMDTIGAVLGPLLALVYLYFYPTAYRTLFLLAFAPGLLAIVATFLIKESTKNTVVNTSKTVTPFLLTHYWKKSDARYKKLVTVLLLIAVVNSSDAFLLLQLKQIGMQDSIIIGVYILYNAVYAICAYPLGKLADGIGLKKIFIFGLLLFVLVYTGFAFNNTVWVAVLLMLIYGVYAACTEGIAKAWISNVVAPTETATALGTFGGLQSIASMLASIIAGCIWYKLGATYCFLLTAIVVCLVIIYLLTKHFNNNILQPTHTNF